MAQPFAPLKSRSSLGSDIALALQKRIRDGTWKPGDVLPGQRELALQFGASLASVREAVSVLSAAGLLEAKPGKGTIVRSVGDAAPEFEGWLGVLGSGQEAAELAQARKLLEQHSVQQAAKTASSEDAAKLYGLLAQMHKAVRDQDAPAYAEGDIAFHIGIAEIAGNRVIVRLMRSMHTALYQLFREGVRRAFVDGHIRTHLEMHRALTEAIVAHDQAGALRVLTEMLDGSSPEYIAFVAADPAIQRGDDADTGLVTRQALEVLRGAYLTAIGPAADLLFEETAERLNLRVEFLPVKYLSPFVQGLARTIEDPQLREDFLARVRGLSGLERQLVFKPTQRTLTPSAIEPA
jgi:GntR family transcriptional regulator, transcriptional repressor for pyruvate dehydrogenase complex